MSETCRLSKRVAEQFICSRSEAEQYIEGGWITVDGQLQDEVGARVAPHQVVARLADAVLAPIEPVTILLHKPCGLPADGAIDPALGWIAPATRCAADQSGQRFLRRHTRALTLTNALDDQASGLLVLTQDWRIVRKLQTESARIEQEFVIDVRGTLPAEQLQSALAALRWNGKPVSGKLSWQSEQRLRYAQKGVERGMVTHICNALRLEVTAMKRLRIGRIGLGGL
ncbi:MAG: RNA pseudouridine synthase, partial [Pseudomonadota bacterium]|nr:RNA pseudouridine synthase [Pseudomonadota bacterium]